MAKGTIYYVWLAAIAAIIISGVGVFGITKGYYEAKIDRLNSDSAFEISYANVELNKNAMVIDADNKIIAQKEAEIQRIGDAATKYIQELESRPPKTVEIIKEVTVIRTVNITKEAVYFPDEATLIKWLPDHVIQTIVFKRDLSKMSQSEYNLLVFDKAYLSVDLTYALIKLAYQDGFILESEELSAEQYRAIYESYPPSGILPLILKARIGDVWLFVDPQHENKIIYREKLGE